MAFTSGIDEQGEMAQGHAGIATVAITESSLPLYLRLWQTAQSPLINLQENLFKQPGPFPVPWRSESISTEEEFIMRHPNIDRADWFVLKKRLFNAIVDVATEVL